MLVYTMMCAQQCMQLVASLVPSVKLEAMVGGLGVGVGNNITTA